MKQAFNTLKSNLKLFRLYKNVFSLEKVFTGVVNLITKDPVSFPLTINLLVTDKCNYFCKMCFNWQRNGINHHTQEEVGIETIKAFISQVRDQRPIFHIGGGEPFMRKDLLDIISAIKKNGLKCLITTNGFLMSRDAISTLVELEVDVLIVSLYGTEDIHDRIVGVEGAFKRTIGNLKYVLENRSRHTKVLISSIVLPGNVSFFTHFLDDMQSLGVDGIKIEQLNFLTPKEYNELSNKNKKGDFDLCPSVFVNGETFAQKFVSDIARLNEDICRSRKNVYLKPYLNQAQLRDWYCGLPRRNHKCGFITHSVFINYNGDILPCQFFEGCVLGNIKRESLKDVWLSERYKKLRQTINASRSGICMRCCKN
ncbi:radical SAM/SPASM domain-containing protein [Candidatus Omnitrophota bacterium]